MSITNCPQKPCSDHSSVGNLANTHFAADMFMLPLKTKENPKGIFTEHELYMSMAVIFACVFFDLEPTKSWPLHRVSYKLAQALGSIIEANVKTVKATGFLSKVVDEMRDLDYYLTDYGVHMIRRLLNTGLDASQVAWSQVLPTALASVPNQSQVFTQVLDFYLSPRGATHLPELNRLAKTDSPEADEKILKYAMEGIRMNGTFGSYREASTYTSIEDGGKTVSIKPGDKVFVSFVAEAAMDPNIFPNPEEIRLDRPIENYLHYGAGPHTCLGADVNKVAITAMLKTVCRLDNLRRAPGPKGELKKIPRPGGFYIYMREDYGSYFPFPLST